jgi:hypothetical protein
MTRPCNACGLTYEAHTAASKYCSPRCRLRAHRSPAKAVDAPTAPPRDLSASGLVIATTTALESAHVLDSVLGQVAVEIAGRIVNPAETGAAVAALAKQLRETMTAALDGSEVVVVDPLDDLRSRRDRKRWRG